METEASEQMDVPAFQFENSTLNNRCKDVFGCLDALEAKHSTFERSRAEEDAELDRRLEHDSPSQEYAGEDSVSTEFKKPLAPSERDYHSSKKGGRHDHAHTGHRTERTSQRDAESRTDQNTSYGRTRGFRGRYGRGRGRATPDYKIHPDRWTQYSLEDVDISDAANKQAAFAFLQERRDAKENGMAEEKADVNLNACSSGQITFKRPSKSKLASRKTSEEKPMDERTSGSVDVEMTEETKGADDCMDMEQTEDGGQKRKFVEETGEVGSDASEKPVEFKSRKVRKRNIRSRREKTSDDQDSD